jgi:hypothetical protein
MAGQRFERIEVPGNSLGTGNREGLDVVTYGERRLHVRSTAPVVEAELVTADPDAHPNRPGWFFRTSGGKQQFCVRFSSGAIQIIATEP